MQLSYFFTRYAGAFVLPVMFLLTGLLAFPPSWAIAASEAVAAPPGRQLKIGFIYISPVGDAGWSYTHDLARRELARDPGITTYMVENVPEGPDSENIIRSMSERGYDIIVATSFGYGEPLLRVARDFPSISYLHCSGLKTGPNVSTFFGRMYQARYLSGIAAGMMTRTNIIGYVAAFPIPEVIRGINAFALGVREVNPEAEIRVTWTRTWYDPLQEREAAEEAITGGADVIAQHQDSTGPQAAAQERGVYSVGYSSDMSAAAPDAHLVAPIWNWTPYYRAVAERVGKGTWTAGSVWLGMESGIVDLSAFGSMVPQEVRGAVSFRKQEIISGKRRVFQGPVRDQSGSVRIEAGSVPQDQELLSMDWFVEGVVGAPE